MFVGLGMNMGMGLGASSSGSGAPPAATGDPLSFAVTGNVILEPDGSGHGAFINGWTATVVFKGLAPDANVNAFDGSKVTLSVTDPGYTTAGAATTVNRTIKGSIVVRRPWPNNGSRQITTVGSDLQLIIALEDIIYQGTTINSVAFAAAAYPGSNALTLSGATVTNSSTRAYPKPYFAWLNRQFEREATSSFNVEAVAYHRHGMNGQMVACIEFTGKDPAGNAATVQRASAPALSSIQTRGNIVEAYKASIPLGSLNNSTTTAAGPNKVHAKVYPWIGDSTAILDTEVTGLAWPTQYPVTSLQFCNDKNGTYGGAQAWVKAGASGGTVGSSATPFPTIVAAFNALTTYNNANKGHNDHSGSTVFLMDDGAGGAVTHITSGNPTSTTGGLAWSTITADPNNTAEVRYQLSVGQANLPSLTAVGAGVVVYNNGNANPTAGWAVGTALTGLLSLDGCKMDMSVSGSAAGAAQLIRANYAWMRNVEWTDPSPVTNHNVATNGIFINLMLGNTAAGTINFTWQYATIGNRTIDCFLGGDPSGTLPAADGLIYANNSNLKVTNAARSVKFGFTAFTYTQGFAIVQNEVELLGNGASSILFNMAADGNIRNIPECLDVYNTVLGNRGNWLYCDNAGSAGLEKRGVSRFSIWFSKPIKTDTFANDSGSNSNWEYCYMVGSQGVTNMCGAATEGGTLTQSVLDPGAGANNCSSLTSNWLGHYRPTNSYIGSGTTGYATVTFVDDKTLYVGTGTGLGDYHLTGVTNNAYSRVPAGLAMLKYDLGGTARKNDGFGAAGAYERTDI